jgi:hypothetical protein
MTMNTQQPKALQLADSLENLEATGWGGDCFALTENSEKQANLAAAELRRLHSVNAELLDALSKYIAAGAGNSTDFAIQREAFFLAKGAIAKAQG